MPLNSPEPDPLKTKVPCPGSTMTGAASAERSAPITRMTNAAKTAVETRTERDEFIGVNQLAIGIVLRGAQRTQRTRIKRGTTGKTRPAAEEVAAAQGG